MAVRDPAACSSAENRDMFTAAKARKVHSGKCRGETHAMLEVKGLAPTSASATRQAARVVCSRAPDVWKTTHVSVQNQRGGFFGGYASRPEEDDEHIAAQITCSSYVFAIPVFGHKSLFQLSCNVPHGHISLLV